MFGLIIWIAMSVMVTYPYVNQIEKVENKWKKIFSYIVFAVGGPMIFFSGLIIGVLEGLGVDFEGEDGDLWG